MLSVLFLLFGLPTAAGLSTARGSLSSDFSQIATSLRVHEDHETVTRRRATIGTRIDLWQERLTMMGSRSDRRAREEIHELHLRYGRAVDTNDLDLIRTVFTDDAVVRYDPPGGQGAAMHGWDEFHAFWVWIQTPMECVHQFTNFTCEVAGAEGSYSCLLFAQHWPRGADFSQAVPLRTVGGRYTSRVRQCVDGWRIYDHRMQALWTSGNAEEVWPSMG